MEPPFSTIAKNYDSNEEVSTSLQGGGEKKDDSKPSIRQAPYKKNCVRAE